MLSNYALDAMDNDVKTIEVKNSWTPALAVTHVFAHCETGLINGRVFVVGVSSCTGASCVCELVDSGGCLCSLLQPQTFSQQLCGSSFTSLCFTNGPSSPYMLTALRLCSVKRRTRHARLAKLLCCWWVLSWLNKWSNMSCSFSQE